MCAIDGRFVPWKANLVPSETNMCHEKRFFSVGDDYVP